MIDQEIIVEKPVRAGVVVRKGVELQAACVAARKLVVVTGRTEMAVLLRGILAAGSGEDVLEHPSYDPDRLGLVLHVTNIPELAPAAFRAPSPVWSHASMSFRM